MFTQVALKFQKREAKTSRIGQFIVGSEAQKKKKKEKKYPPGRKKAQIRLS